MKPLLDRPPYAGFVIIGHLLFAGLFVLSLVHWRERVVHVDSAYQVFKWLQQGGVEVEAHRYSAVLPQLLVKISRGLYMGLVPLLVLASVFHVLVPWAAFAIAAHVWRTPWVAAAAALAAVLCTRLAFYGMVLEAHYLILYPFLLAAALLGPMLRRRDRTALVIAFITLLLTLLAHPLGLPVALYVLAFCFFAEPRVRGPVALLALMALLLGGGLRLVLPSTGYERDVYQGLADGLTRFTELKDLPSFDHLAGHTWTYTTTYLPAGVLMVVTLVLLVRRKSWGMALLVLLGVPLFLLAILLTFHQGESALMMEKNFLPLATLIALPLMWGVARLPERARYWALVPFALVLFIQLRGVAFASKPAHQRYAILEQLVAEARAAGIRKGVVPQERLADLGIGIVWALPFESLLISAMQGPTSALTLIATGDEGAPASQGVALPPLDHDLPAGRMRRRFFQLPEGPYTILDRPTHSPQ